MCSHAAIVVDFSQSNKLELTKGDIAMPMIEVKVTPALPAEKRDILKAEFGKASWR